MLRGEQAVDPAGRAATARDRHLDLHEHVEAILETAVSARLHDAEQVGLPHPRDHLLADAARGFGLSRALTRNAGDLAGPREEFGNVGPLRR